MERHWNQVTRRLSEGDGARHGGDRRPVRGAAPARTTSPSSSTSAQNRFGISHGGAAAGQSADAAAQAVLRPARPRAVRRDPRQRQAAVLDRHRRPVAARGDPRQARPGDPALRRAARPGLRLQLAHLPALDGRHLGRAADGGDPVPAQPDPADPAAGRGRRRLRQGPARCRTTSGRAARARCARRRRRSWRCASASAITSSSARPCWPASATTCAPC